MSPPLALSQAARSWGLVPARSTGGRAARERDAYRGSAHSRGYGKRHRKWRLLVLNRDPKCIGYRMPGSPSLTVAHRSQVVQSTVADHVMPLRAGGGWELSNGQGLCALCHGAKTREENALFMRASA